eukprot:TRINITY_DN576_c0_g2_i1.p1 TRINITY_DN576_c0_g2~~TRINITY_DN576_c0_g2_i1.p1  ORF type:complete len:315 (+),score=76.97 TRINITY_DN576_c0_g2_i1:100-1044(+)
MTSPSTSDASLLFTEFSWFPLPMNVHYGYLAGKARPELWGVEPDTFAILEAYLVHTYLINSRKKAVVSSADGEFCCFDTGLLTPRLKQIYAVFQKNKNVGMQSWFFKGWYDHSEAITFGKFSDLPTRPALSHGNNDIFFDPRIETEKIKANILDEESKALLQRAGKSVANLDSLFDERVEGTMNLVAHCPMIAVPVYIPSSMKNAFALPLFISSLDFPDLSIIVEKVAKSSQSLESNPEQWTYKFICIMSIPSTYKYARLLGKIESDWLVVPNATICTARNEALKNQIAVVNEHRQNLKSRPKESTTPSARLDK